MRTVLETGLAGRGTTPEIEELEKRESELWLRYRELDRRAAELKDAGDQELYNLTRRDAVRAHRNHQLCADLIFRIHRDRLFERIR